MKALPLWQPWAQLVALGVKRVETRDYHPGRIGLHFGQRIAIHATKTRRELRFCGEPYFRDHVPDPDALPLGCLIATCVIDRAREMTEESIRLLWSRNPQEHAFGLYQPGRWAWVLRDIVQLGRPVPWTGSQGTFDVPDDLEAHAAQGVLLG